MSPETTLPGAFNPRLIAGLLLLCAFLPPSVHARQELSRAQAESRLEALGTEITSLQNLLARSRERFKKEQAQLREIDLEIQASTLKLRALENTRAGHEQGLRQLESERSDYLRSLQTRKNLLGEQIVSAYQLGRESRLKLLLNQDSPARLNRMLAYYEYFSRAQISQIRDLLVALSTLDGLQTDIDNKLLQLGSVQQQSETELQALHGRRVQRQSVVAGLAGKIDNNEARLLELGRNRRDLETLLQRLASALAEIPSNLGEYLNPAQQRGALPMPLSGRVLHAFGQSRLGGMRWQGWLIEAEPGSDVHVIAYGRVAYADWLRGYGLLMIIDHGDGILSLYGNNESLLYGVGDWVQPGTLISTVGASPGASQGLYFELRNHGKAIDPATWLSR